MRISRWELFSATISAGYPAQNDMEGLAVLRGVATVKLFSTGSSFGLALALA